ncbi:solute carrier family 25 member 33 [Micractinium conductrix]|uniref:Solute carrier family 25 member 33 n=1 Tax=Micractinium conductrix TaxID=554055 RepID=A0A2P6V3K1_9CHLO|nr:solute carrier family 25 member 33 [Micractinium conductrix]|eukprot:PSC68654.1 solute carrier family 25 member 33 [Micractinium conductrix]
MSKAAIIVSTLSLLAASALPAVLYYYVFQHAGLVIGPVAWAHWIVVGVATTFGVLAHGQGSNALLALHAALCCMLGAGLAGWDTAFAFQLDTRCETRQVAFAGCDSCTCAQDNTCTAALLANDPTCSSCVAYPSEVCIPALRTQNKMMMSFMGLAALVFLALPAFYSLLVLVRQEAGNTAAAAKRTLVSFSVDQQTALVEAGEKPSVTPPMLGAWVGFLLDCGDAECVTTGEKCRAALASRGFDLPITRAPAARGKKQLKGSKSSKKGAKNKMSADATADGLSVAESGGSRVRGSQVAAEEQRDVQFMTRTAVA